MKKIINYITLLTMLCLSTTSNASDIEADLNIEVFPDGEARLNIENWNGHGKVLIENDDQRDFFFGSDSNIKSSIDNYFGKRPDDVFYKDSNNDHDMYRKYGWERPWIRSEIKKIEIVDFKREKTMVTETFVDNERNEIVDLEKSILLRFENRAKSSFSNTQMLGVSHTIGFNFKIFGNDISNSTTLSTQFTFNQSGEEERKEIAQFTDTLTADNIKPYSTTGIRIMAYYGTAKLKITHRQRVLGKFAVNYQNKHKNHHYWGIPVSNVLKYSGMPIERTSIQTVDVDIYSNVRINTKDFILFNPHNEDFGNADNIKINSKLNRLINFKWEKK